MMPSTQRKPWRPASGRNSRIEGDAGFDQPIHGHRDNSETSRERDLLDALKNIDDDKRNVVLLFHCGGAPSLEFG
jgi:hypothetical protein